MVMSTIDISNSDVWDDSALIASWNDALQEYKVSAYRMLWYIKCATEANSRDRNITASSKRCAPRLTWKKNLLQRGMYIQVSKVFFPRLKNTNGSWNRLGTNGELLEEANLDGPVVDDEYEPEYEEEEKNISSDPLVESAKPEPSISVSLALISATLNYHTRWGIPRHH
ncbi:hypothetical protein Cpir12675_004609 [Ceratocystis pirilliformis]|uniref:Survival Motor Neuron Gemin2-binding domain-containing protein n=1 Tax=Ceratocystis pirilliformis TaxID=259994 RepID=A0ABR3YWL7_9PEZI